MTALLLAMALSAHAQLADPGVIDDGRHTLYLEYGVGWTPATVWIVRGGGYRERWTTVSVWHADGTLFTWGPWMPGRFNTLNKPFPGFTSGKSYRVDVRRGYNADPTDGALLISGTFEIP